MAGVTWDYEPSWMKLLRKAPTQEEIDKYSDALDEYYMSEEYAEELIKPTLDQIEKLKEINNKEE